MCNTSGECASLARLLLLFSYYWKKKTARNVIKIIIKTSCLGPVLTLIFILKKKKSNNTSYALIAGLKRGKYGSDYSVEECVDLVSTGGGV